MLQVAEARANRLRSWQFISSFWHYAQICGALSMLEVMPCQSVPGLAGSCIKYLNILENAVHDLPGSPDCRLAVLPVSGLWGHSLITCEAAELSVGCLPAVLS